MAREFAVNSALEKHYFHQHINMSTAQERMSHSNVPVLLNILFVNRMARVPWPADVCSRISARETLLTSKQKKHGYSKQERMLGVIENLNLKLWVVSELR